MRLYMALPRPRIRRHNNLLIILPTAEPRFPGTADFIQGLVQGGAPPNYDELAPHESYRVSAI
jgi:hypothetical protein